VILKVKVYPLLSYLMRGHCPEDSLLNVKECLIIIYYSWGRRVDESALGILLGKGRTLNKPSTTSPNMANKTVKCICIARNTVVKREG
jgi:hypothetical protein